MNETEIAVGWGEHMTFYDVYDKADTTAPRGKRSFRDSETPHYSEQPVTTVTNLLYEDNLLCAAHLDLGDA